MCSHSHVCDTCSHCPTLTVRHDRQRATSQNHTCRMSLGNHVLGAVAWPTAFTDDAAVYSVPLDTTGADEVDVALCGITLCDHRCTASTTWWCNMLLANTGHMGAPARAARVPVPENTRAWNFTGRALWLEKEQLTLFGFTFQKASTTWFT